VRRGRWTPAESREIRILAICHSACVGPRQIVICHNANCGEPTDPARDDTLPAFRESLALEDNGRPVIDGIELDSFWRGAQLSFFWFSTTTEVFAAIRKYHPFAVDTSEARLMRRWLER
jgi:hypothetical protein